MNVGEIQRKLSMWAEQDKERKFYDLYRLLYDKDWLLLAHDYVRQNAGSVTAGCDGVNMAYFDEDPWGNLRKIAEELRSGAFEPYPVRRVYIPKRNGKLRPLGIPSIRDRIVQEALRMILEPIFEADFVQTSYGFRPNRRTLDAVQRILWAACENRKFFWVIEGDISSYFDTIHHRTLMKLLRRRLDDERILGLIWRFLKAGVVERNVLRATTDQGTPQGGIISPLLANVYLHELDKYMERYTALSEYQKAKRRKQGLGNFVHVRYADDFVVMSNGTREQAEALKAELTTFLREKLHLTLSEEKTTITHLNDGFSFLGFRFHRCRGLWRTKTKCLIPRGAVNKHLDKLREATAPSTCQDSVKTKYQAMNRIIAGWCRYYQCTANLSRNFSRLSHLTFWLIGHWCARKFKTKIRKAIQPFKQEDNSLATGETRLRFHHEHKRKSLWIVAFSKPNPYTTQEKIERDELLVDPSWTGYEDRPGQADLKLQVLQRDGSDCLRCKNPVTERTCELHHLREVQFFKRPVDANTPGNCGVLCIPCHKEVTKSRRQQLESRMQ